MELPSHEPTQPVAESLVPPTREEREQPSSPRKMRGFGVHAATWCALLAVLGLFQWLNMEWSREEYVERTATSWRGGTREGFPWCWWEAGLESSAGVTDAKLFLLQRPYGGWVWSGIAANLAVFALAAALTALLSERLLRATQRASRSPERSAQHPQELAAAKLRALRPLTGVVAVSVLSLAVCGNLMTFTSSHGGGREGYSQRMGMPFVTYSASRPEVNGVVIYPNRSQTETQALASVENNPRVMWRLAHWHVEGIIANSFVIMLLVIGSACASEKLLRRQ